MSQLLNMMPKSNPEALDMAFEAASGIGAEEAKTEKAPQASAAPAATIPPQDEQKKEKEAPQAQNQETKEPDQEAENGEHGKLDLSRITYELEMPKQDGAAVIERSALHPAVEALPPEVKGELVKRGQAFASSAIVRIFQEHDIVEAGGKGVAEIARTMTAAYMATQLARAALDHDETSTLRATISGAPVLDAILEKGFAEETVREAELKSGSKGARAASEGAEGAAAADPHSPEFRDEVARRSRALAGATQMLAEAIEDQTAALQGETPSAAALPVSGTDPATQAEDAVMAAARGGMGIVMNGDPEADLPADHELTVSERMEKMGFPQRPKLWPAMMAWPMQPDFDMLAKRKASQEALQEYLRGLQEMQARMLARADEINEYILKHNDPESRRGSRLRKGARLMTLGMADPLRRLDDYNLTSMTLKDQIAMRHLKRTRDDPHHGIRWASLLDEKSTRPAANIVREWSHARATTNDGGIVIAGREHVTFGKITEQAVALSIHEGIARGWGTFKMQGDMRFAQAALQAARQANVKAEITEFYGPWNMFKRRHVVTPAPPGMTSEAARVETETLGPVPASGASTPDAAPEALSDEARRNSIRKISDLSGGPGEKRDAAEATEVRQEEEEDVIAWTDAGTREVAEKIQEPGMS